MINVNDKFKFPELITTLLYASAVCSMMSVCINRDVITVPLVFNTVIITFLVFADWHNRILTPLGFPDADQKNKQKPIMQFFKLSFEVIGMYFLVVFFSYFIKEQNNLSLIDINKYNAFAGYLFMSFFWNYVAFKIMKGLDAKPLMIGIIKGNVFDMPGLNDYTGTFKKKVQDTEAKLEREFSDNGNKKSFTEKISMFHKKIEKEGLATDLARVTAQFLANHLIWANAFVSLFILFSLRIGKPDSSILEMIFSNLLFENLIKSFYSCTTILVVFLLVLLYTSFRAIRKHKTLSGILIVIMLILFYCSFSAGSIIYVMIIQQIIVGVLIQIVTQNGGTGQRDKESIIDIKTEEL